MGVHVYGALDFDNDPGAKWRVRVDGWDSGTGSTVVLTQKPSASRAVIGPRFKKPKPMMISGSVTVDNPALLVPALGRLKKAISIDPTTLTITRYGLALSASVVREGQVDVQRYASPYFATFSAQLQQEDHRKFGVPIVASTFLPSSSGGITWPLTFPAKWNSQQVSGLITINNPGDEVGKVLLRIDGPAPSPMVTHLGSGKALMFASGYSLGAGNWLDIDMDNKSVLENGQASRAGFVSSRGWFGLDPGDNQFAFNVAGAYNPTAKLTVTAYPAYE
ncbi:MAG TPA: hypothetical protein VJ851_00625 [Jatrophihabitans sp.]|nr:hypothetical protein [Jatrophihabitans sp.]